MPVYRVAALATSLIALSAAATAPAPLDVPVRSERLYVSYVIKPDGSQTQTREAALRILKQQAIEHSKQVSIGYSTSVERIEVLEAYTRKPDGRRIDVPRANYQLDINKGRESDAPAFSDRTSLSLIFPDVSVDDVLVLKYRLTDTEPMFPGQFSANERFNTQAAYDDVKVRVDYPESLWMQHATTGMTQSADESRDGRHVLEWKWSNPTPRKSTRHDYSVYDADTAPGYSLSTFRSYGQIAEEYGKRARPKAVVSKRVRALAEEVTEGIREPREQARMLYEWVATNINYAGNCVGVGAVVPRDQEFVLDNRMGDCKDQATLLQALLAAKGITSTQALVNSGSAYHLPKVPVVSMVNHVIVYVPGLDLFLDPTSGTTPFGMLPLGDSDKPVLLVDGYRDGLRTTALASAANRANVKTVVTVKPDGSIAGVVQVSVSGLFAVSGRDRLRNLTAQEREDFMKSIYRRDNKTGFGRLESDDPKPMRKDFRYKVTFETEDFAQVPGPGAFTISPLYSSEASIGMVASMTEDEEEARETNCLGGTVVEEYTYKFPKDMKILAVPRDVHLASGPATYQATYALKGDELHVTRELVDRTDRNVCPVSVQRDFAALARKVVKDLKAQVVYQ